MIKEYKKVYERESEDGKSDAWKQKYDPKNFRALNYQLAELKTELSSNKDRSDIKQPTRLKKLNLNEISKRLWIEIPRNDFISLIKEVVDNLDNNDFQTTVNKRKYDWNNAEKYLLKIIIKKISKNEALELYNSLIKPDVRTLNNALNRGRNRRNNILAILDKIKSSLFDNVYFHYQDKLSEAEESIAQGTKLRRQRSDEIAKKEKKISLDLFKRYFDYLNPNSMYKALNETKISGKNRAQVNTIENRLTNLIETLKSSPTSDSEKIKNRNNTLDIVELILYFNQPNQAGQGQKF